MPSPSADERWMRNAIELGQRNIGQVWPSPAVGCILVKDGLPVGRGWTGPGGIPHAEAAAIRRAGDQCKNATAYVSLEPCAHFGKTPPCSKALIEAGIARVVTAMTDPDPRVSGKGHQELENAGIEVSTNVLRRQAIRSHSGFIYRVTKQRPFVTLKSAASLDGRIATRTGESQWITAETTRRHVHLLRAQHDAVLVGRGTVVADDPSLTVRLPGLEDRSPVRVVFDSLARSPVESKLGTTAHEVPVWICHTDAAPAESLSRWRNTGAETVSVASLPSGSIDPERALVSLAEKGLTRVLCEGGGTLAASLVRSEMVDELLLYSAGLVIGSEGKAVIGSTNWTRLADVSRFRLDDVSTIGNDMFSRWITDGLTEPL